MSECCPTCGAPLEGVKVSWNPVTSTFVTDAKACRFTRRQAKIFSALWAARNRGGFPTTASFMDAAYADCIDGGPTNFNTLSVLFDTMRKTLSGSGYTISKNVGNPRTGYNLVREAA